MVCRKTQPVHLEREAESARRAAALKADRGKAVALRKKAALRTDVQSLPPAARAASMTRVADALTEPHARAALVTNPRGAAYHKAYAGGIAGGMSGRLAVRWSNTGRHRVWRVGSWRDPQLGFGSTSASQAARERKRSQGRRSRGPHWRGNEYAEWTSRVDSIVRWWSLLPSCLVFIVILFFSFSSHERELQSGTNPIASMSNSFGFVAFLA